MARGTKSNEIVLVAVAFNVIDVRDRKGTLVGVELFAWFPAFEPAFFAGPIGVSLHFIGD
jgi:hypothetical protein